MRSVLFVHQSAELYGSDRTLLMFLKNVDKNLFNCVVILPENGPLKTEIETLEIPVFITPVLKLYRNIFSIKNVFRFFRDKEKALQLVHELHKKHQFSVVYSNTLAVLLGAFFAKKHKIRHLWHVHEIIVHPKIIANIFPKILNHYADTVVCNSNATKQNLISRNNNLVLKTQTIYNGLEILSTAHSTKTKADFGYLETDIIITLVGRISRLKGHKWLLKTIVENFKDHKNLKILFVGSPVAGQEFYEYEINEFVVLHNLSNVIKILPFSKTLNEIWNITDIAIMPSTEAESFGLVAAEAMLAKKPVIASDHGGLQEIIVNNETGFLIEPNNKIALAVAIKKLAESLDLRNKFGEKGFLKIQKDFSVKKYTEQLQNAILNL